MNNLIKGQEGNLKRKSKRKKLKGLRRKEAMRQLKCHMEEASRIGPKRAGLLPSPRVNNVDYFLELQGAGESSEG